MTHCREPKGGAAQRNHRLKQQSEKIVCSQKLQNLIRQISQEALKTKVTHSEVSSVLAKQMNAIAYTSETKK